MLRVWFQRPARWRVEAVDGSGVASPQWVVDSPRWWRWIDAATVVTNATQAGPDLPDSPGWQDSPDRPMPDEPLASSLDPARWLPGLRLSRRTEVEVLGRRAWAADAVPEGEGGAVAGPGLPWLGAEAYRLVIDAERGVVLQAEALLDGRAFASFTWTDIAFDERLPEGTFEPGDLSGMIVRPPRLPARPMARMPRP